MQKSKSKSPPRWGLERGLYRSGVNLICGVDEAGRGPLAGPVVAAAVIFPPAMFISGVDDS
ncbi:MAG: ribonuclease HII, partial [Candidatus Zixiibacteriota bacterium]